MALEFEPNPLLMGGETFDQFDVELHLLKKNMQQEVMKAIKLFLQFLKLFDSHQIHNMFALMLDPHFKSLQFFEKYVGHKITIHIVVEYDVKEVTPLLMIIFPWLKLIVQLAQAIVLIDGFAFKGENEKSFMGIGYW
jgi:hypothetical protein